MALYRFLCQMALESNLINLIFSDDDTADRGYKENLYSR